MHSKHRLTLDTLARADLVLPLSGHDLGVGAGDCDASVDAGTEVRLDDITLDNLAGANTTVVWALRSGETLLTNVSKLCLIGNIWLHTPAGHPKGRSLESRRVYSCSRPNHGTWSACAAMSFAHS